MVTVGVFYVSSVVFFSSFQYLLNSERKYIFGN